MPSQKKKNRVPAIEVCTHKNDRFRFRTDIKKSLMISPIINGTPAHRMIKYSQ